MKKLLLLPLAFALGACTTIHFDNGSVQQAQRSEQTYAQWHHILLLDLYEASEPVNPHDKCPGSDWASVKTELTFLNGIARIPANLYLPLWYPKTVSVTCQ